jgi:hypothetical protein
MRPAILAAALVVSTVARAESKPPKAGKEMTAALEALNKALGLESHPPPHCVNWGVGHQITVDEVRGCAEKALPKSVYPQLGEAYVVAVLMSAVGPQTVLALALDEPGWAVLSCDPGRPCPPRRAGVDKMGKRVVDRTERACKSETTLWFPEKKGCPAATKD